MISNTPMMKQWNKCKEKAKGALLLFRLGDFYEAFYEDAQIISKKLELTLTKRQNVPMCGVPFHALDGYLDKLIAQGQKVAIAEQMEDPKTTKGIVKRDIARIVTPGTVINSNLIKDKSNNFFLSITQLGMTYGLSCIDLTTSEFFAIEIEGEKELINEIFRINPSEILISKKFKKLNEKILDTLALNLTFVLNEKDDWYFDHDMAMDKLLNHFKIHSLDSFGLKSMIAAINASGALIAHLTEDLVLNLSHIKKISTETLSSYMSLDYSCMKNLEIIESNTKNSSLLDLLDNTKTPMGGRLLKNWIKLPLISKDLITKRLDSIEEILKNYDIFLDIHSNLDNIRDLQRIIMKIINNYATPRDLATLRFSLEFVPKIKELLEDFQSDLIKEDLCNIKDISALLDLLQDSIEDNPPIRTTEGNIFKDGYNKDLDELRIISKDSKSWIANYQNILREKYQIKTLKVGFTRVFGYYIEVSKGQSNKMPDSFNRRQTLVNAERYISDELKDFEHKVLSAEGRIKALESKLYNEFREKLITFADDIESISQAIARIDVLFSLAKVARSYKYSRPVIDNSNILDIKDGRHPIIEASSDLGEFIPNDTYLNDDNQLFLITGPNMAGKSTYIRQVALIVIMAQIGSYVPAASAHIGIVDRVFSRIGASDDLAKGQSTFMVEMIECANILNNATEKSLIILDEIGRGTSTYDGIAIAWAVAEYLLNTTKAKTLFATHYWELTKLQDKIKTAVNYNVAVKETNSGIVFLRKIIQGGCDKSYGIHVAKLAGLPYSVIKKANEMLLDLEKNSNRSKLKIKKPAENQFLLFNQNDTSNLKHQTIIKEIKEINLETLTPIETMQKLLHIQQKIKSDG